MAGIVQLAEHHPDLPQWIREVVEGRGHSWADLVDGRLWGREDFPFRDLAQLRRWVIFSDPVHFAECCLIDTDVDPPRPWRLWPYQVPALRLDCNLLHPSAPETGKTRLLFARAAWVAITKKGADQLIAGALHQHSQKIFRMFRDQAARNPWFDSQIDWKKTTRDPYMDLAFHSGNKIFFRPGGHDGTALRGEHVRGGVYLDEAPKSKNRQVMENLLSRAKRGCPVWILGTPDGDLGCWFYELCAKVQEEDPLNPQSPPGATGGDGPFVKLRWPLTLSPEWTEERNRKALSDYGGYESPGYQQNVLGNWGDPADGVFPWVVFRACLGYLPEFVLLKILCDDERARFLVEGFRQNPDYKIRRPGDETEASGVDPLLRFRTDEPKMALFEDDSQEVRVGKWERYLREFLGGGSAFDCALVLGVDFGSRRDPTEILAAQPIADRRRWLLRVQLRRFNYEAQADFLYALDRLLLPSHGWGLEATSVGTAVEHFLRRPIAGKLLDHSRFAMHAVVEELDELGRPRLDENTGKSRKVSLKELSTRLLERAMQSQALEIPWDPDMMVQFPGHTKTGEGPNGRQFAKTKDDVIEAARVLELRLWAMSNGGRGTGAIRHRATGATASRRLGTDFRPPQRPALTGGRGLGELFA